jgi:hypothetical protein
MVDGVARRGAGAAVGAEIRILFAPPLATPVAMVPTPASETSFTETVALGLAFLRSKMSSARSSIE